MDQADKPATIKELNQLQLDLLEKLYESSARMEQKLNDFTEQVLPRLAVVEALTKQERAERREEQSESIGSRTLVWIALGVVVAFLSSVSSLVISLIHVHI